MTTEYKPRYRTTGAVEVSIKTTSGVLNRHPELNAILTALREDGAAVVITLDAVPEEAAR